jgi:hypothetical protein
MMVSRARSAGGRDRSDRGAAMVLGAILFALLALPLCAIGVDTARWWVEAARVQAVADAASAAGVTYMPDNFASAKARALEVAKTNGYQPGSGTTVTVTPGGVPTQLKVTVTQTVDNFFAKSFGEGTSRITRTAVADYNGPAPIGNPCNAFGNEPTGTTKAGPAASQLLTPAGAQCSSKPDFWASINGPDIDKTQGERFAARQCDGGEDGCDSSKKNTEFDPLGYFYTVRVTTPNVPVTIQVYDPASVPTGQQCELRPKWSNTATNNANDWTNADARKRYGFPNNNDPYLCPGDNDMQATSSQSSEQPTVTSFALRGPTATQVPVQGEPVTSCAPKQYRGFKMSEVTAAALTKGNANYKDGLASVFHQWNTLCTFVPDVAGEYYLQVRSNVKFSGSSTDTTSTGNTKVLTQMDDDTSVKGTAVNSFGLRAYSSAGGVAVSAFKRMRIFVNGANAQTTFNLVRIVPAAKGKTLDFGFFDVGEGAVGSSYMKIVPPADSNVSAASGCVATGYRNQSVPNCQLSISTAFNGKQQNMRMPIPSTYTCNYNSQGGCWWRVVVDFGGSDGVHDATTWTADIVGEPVRLVE